MKMHYYFDRLSKDEKELLEAILMEEIDIQVWYALAWIDLFGGEVFVHLQ